MASIDDTPHGEQEGEEGEWETVWEPADPWQEIFRTQKRISDAPQILLDNMARMQADAQIEPPILAMLRRAEQNAAAAMPAWLENLNRTEEMLKRAQGLRPVQRRKQRANTQISRQRPEQPSTPSVAPSQTNIEPPKRNRGNPTVRPFLDTEEFGEYLREYVSTIQDLPSQPQFIRYLDKEKRVTLNKRTLLRYAKKYCEWKGYIERDWRGCVAHFAHLIRQD